MSIQRRDIDADLRKYQEIIATFRKSIADAPDYLKEQTRATAWETAIAEFRKLGVGQEFAAKWLDSKKG